MTSYAPHLLELDPDLVERLGDDGYEHVLHQPGQEEDHGAEVEHSSPAGQTVDGSVHDEHPTLLRGCLVHGEDAGSWNTPSRKVRQSNAL